MVNSGRSSRVGILSNKEVELVKRADSRENLFKERESLEEKKTRTRKEEERLREISRELNEISTRLSALVKDLHKRIIASETDLRIVLMSSSLKPLVTIINHHLIHFPFADEGDYGNYGVITSLAELFPIRFEEQDQEEPIPDYSRWKVEYETKSGARYYWLNTKIQPEPTTKDVSNPEYSIRGIKGTWNEKLLVSDKGNKTKTVTEKIDVRDILKKALGYEKKFQSNIRNKDLPQIFPRTREDAVSIVTIYYKTLDFLKLRIKQNSTIIMSEDNPTKNNQTRKMNKSLEEKEDGMERAYAKSKIHLAKAQKIFREHGLELVFSQKSIRDY